MDPCSCSTWNHFSIPWSEVQGIGPLGWQLRRIPSPATLAVVQRDGKLRRLDGAGAGKEAEAIAEGLRVALAGTRAANERASG